MGVGSAGAAGNQGRSIQIHAPMTAPLPGLSGEVAGRPQGGANNFLIINDLRERSNLTLKVGKNFRIA
jgi:hypothetical protein